MNLLFILCLQSDQHRIGVGCALVRFFWRNCRASSGKVWGHKRHYSVNSSPACLIIMRRRRPENPPRRRFKLARRARYRGRICRINLIIDDTPPHRTITRKINALHIIPGQTTTSQKSLCRDIYRRCTANIRHAFTPEVSVGAHSCICGNSQRLVAIAIGHHHYAQRQRPPTVAEQIEKRPPEQSRLQPH